MNLLWSYCSRFAFLKDVLNIGIVFPLVPMELISFYGLDLNCSVLLNCVPRNKYNFDSDVIEKRGDNNFQILGSY